MIQSGLSFTHATRTCSVSIAYAKFWHYWENYIHDRNNFQEISVMGYLINHSWVGSLTTYVRLWLLSSWYGFWLTAIYYRVSICHGPISHDIKHHVKGRNLKCFSDYNSQKTQDLFDIVYIYFVISMWLKWTCLQLGFLRSKLYAGDMYPGQLWSMSHLMRVIPMYLYNYNLGLSFKIVSILISIIIVIRLSSYPMGLIW